MVLQEHLVYLQNTGNTGKDLAAILWQSVQLQLQIYNYRRKLVLPKSSNQVIVPYELTCKLTS